MSGMVERCYECGAMWGVTMKPHDKVLCTPCARPKPWKNPVWYWQSRLSQGHQWMPPTYVGSAEWWNGITSRQDLQAAIAAAKADDQPEPEKRGTMTDQPGTFTIQPPSWVPRRGDQVRVTQTERPDLARRTGATGPHITVGEVEQSYLQPGAWPYIEVSSFGYLALEQRGVDVLIEPAP